MPAQFQLPPDTRSVGSGNPPADMNGVTDALTAMGAGLNACNALFSGGADPSGVNDSTAAIQAAISAVPVGGGTVTLPPGTFTVSGNLTCTSPYTYIQGAGRWATTIKFTGTGDCLRIYNTSVTGLLTGGGVRDLTIDGTGAGAGSCGLHYGDMRAGELRLAVQNFSGAGSTGVHLDNQYGWTEETHGYLWLTNNTQNLVFDVSTIAGTTVAAGSNGGEISQIASWGGTYGGNGVLDVASTAGYPSTGILNVAASGATTAVITYTGLSGGGSFTGCAYVSGSATGTVATSGTVTLVTSANSFGYTDLQTEILAKVGQDGVVLQNGALLYNSRLTVKANFQGSASAQSNAVLRITGQIPAGHSTGGYSAIRSCRLDIMAECSSALGSNAPQTIVLGTLAAGNTLLGCTGIMDFAQGLLPFAVSNWTATGAAGAFQYAGVIRGDFNLNNATVGLGSAYSFATAGPMVYGKSLLNAPNGNLQVDNGDYFTATLTGNITINLSPGGAATLSGAQRKVLIIKQAASGGPYTVTWPATGSPSTTNCTVIWPGGTAPVMSAAANAADVYFLDTYDGATWYGRAAQATPGAASWGQAVPAGFAPAGPAPTASTSQVMMGLGSTCTYTPAGSGIVQVTVTGTSKTATAASNVTVGGRYGTGTAPTGSYVTTATNASPCVFTAAGSAYANGTTVYLGSTGTVPTGFTAGTLYYVVSPSGTSFSLAATFNGTPINSTSAGTATIYTGTAVTGTRFGPAADPVVLGNGAGGQASFAITGLVTGLTPATAYWFDLAVSTANQLDLATIAAVSVTLVELP